MNSEERNDVGVRAKDTSIMMVDKLVELRSDIEDDFSLLVVFMRVYGNGGVKMRGNIDCSRNLQCQLFTYALNGKSS